MLTFEHASLHAASPLIADIFFFLICEWSNAKSNETVTNNAVSVRSFGINVIFTA